MSPKNPPPAAAITTRPVLCIDDNEWIGESIARLLKRHPALTWSGWMPDAHGIEDRLRDLSGAVILLDVDVPGQDSFEVATRLSGSERDLRIVMLSGHLQVDLVDRAIAAGAWGYVSKNEETSAIVHAIEKVALGEVAFSPAVMDLYHRL